MWIDHNRFADLRTRDDTQPVYFGHRYQVHDGLLDITNESDFVTVSWNQFTSHDKTMLIGNSDSATEDREHLRVTLHHNLFDGVGQRTPRVRFGKVHVYNNVYRADKQHQLPLELGRGHRIADLRREQLLRDERHLRPHGSHRRQEGHAHDGHRQLLAREGSAASRRISWPLHNAQFDPDLQPDAGWTPTLYGSAKAAEPAESARRTRAERKRPRTGLQQQKLTDVREWAWGGAPRLNWRLAP